MSGKNCRRLLAVLPLFLAACWFARGQDSPVSRYESARSPYFEPAESFSLRSPVSVPQPIVSLRYPINPRLIDLRRVTRAAGIIFSGQVVSIGHKEAQAVEPFASNASPISITFQVEDGIVGVTTGQRLTIHEWAGLWNSGEHYRVGEHVFLFLYPPSRLGLTSPVSGRIGRFAVEGGRVLIGAQHIPVLADPTLGGKTIVPYAAFAKAVRQFTLER